MAKEVQLTQGRVALVDDADFAKIAGRSWHFARSARGGHGYALHTTKAQGKVVRTAMHRLVLGEPPAPGLFVDHVSGDTLDNRRENLRWATPQQNLRNSKAKGACPYKGVSHTGLSSRGRPLSRSWSARIKVNGRTIRLGSYATPEEAARAYDAVAVKLFGAFARLNFPDAAAAA